MPQRGRYEAVLFDLLTALLDSWTVWNRTAGSEALGRTWRMEYLRRTYGCGPYRPYETLVAEAAAAVGLDPDRATALETNWATLKPWPGAAEALSALSPTHRLGIVTNCSERLGRLAAQRVGVSFDVIVTSESAGYYKPDPRPYRMALERLDLPADRVLFVAGSAYDLVGTSRIGLDTYWHNRAGLRAPPEAPAPLMESPTLDRLPQLAQAPLGAFRTQAG